MPLNPAGVLAKLRVREGTRWRTHSFPVKVMGNPVLALVWVREHPGRNMLNLGSAARCRNPRTTIVDVDVSSEVRAVEVAHHRSAVVVGCKLVSVDFKGGILWSFDRPFHP